MFTQNTIDKARNKIFKDCSVKNQKLVAMAFASNGRLICVETNKKGCGIISKFSIHAEEGLIKKLKKLNSRYNYKDIFVLVMRYNRISEWSFAKPCIGCERLIRDYGINNIHYTDYGGIIRKI